MAHKDPREEKRKTEDDLQENTESENEAKDDKADKADGEHPYRYSDWASI